MKTLLMLLLFISPLTEVEQVKVSFPTKQYDIFIDYQNDNFSQHLVYYNSRAIVTAELQSSNYLGLDLAFRVAPNYAYINELNPELQAVIKDLMGGSHSLRDYMASISSFLKKNIRYSEEEIPQSAAMVLVNRRAYCVGFSNLVKVFLDAVGVRSELVKGFYLKKDKGAGESWTPVPHRWVEIRLPNGLKFFYDPQYQRFSANYITTKSDVDFKRIRRFKVKVIKQSKKIMN